MRTSFFFILPVFGVLLEDFPVDVPFLGVFDPSTLPNVSCIPSLHDRGSPYNQFHRASPIRVSKMEPDQGEADHCGQTFGIKSEGKNYFVVFSSIEEETGFRIHPSFCMEICSGVANCEPGDVSDGHGCDVSLYDFQDGTVVDVYIIDEDEILYLDGEKVLLDGNTYPAKINNLWNSEGKHNNSIKSGFPGDSPESASLLIALAPNKIETTGELLVDRSFFHLTYGDKSEWSSIGGAMPNSRVLTISKSTCENLCGEFACDNGLPDDCEIEITEHLLDRESVEAGIYSPYASSYAILGYRDETLMAGTLNTESLYPCSFYFTALLTPKDANQYLEGSTTDPFLVYSIPLTDNPPLEGSDGVSCGMAFKLTRDEKEYYAVVSKSGSNINDSDMMGFFLGIDQTVCSKICDEDWDCNSMGICTIDVEVYQDYQPPKVDFPTDEAVYTHPWIVGECTNDYITCPEYKVFADGEPRECGTEEDPCAIMASSVKGLQCGSLLTLQPAAVPGASIWGRVVHLDNNQKVGLHLDMAGFQSCICPSLKCPINKLLEKTNGLLPAGICCQQQVSQAQVKKCACSGQGEDEGCGAGCKECVWAPLQVAFGNRDPSFTTVYYEESSQIVTPDSSTHYPMVLVAFLFSFLP